MLLRNEGPPWTRRGTGEVIPHGGTFTASAQEVDRFQRRKQLGAEFVPVDGAVGVPSPGAAVSTGPPGESMGGAPPPPPALLWPLVMDPAVYLKIHPSGPNAELARAVLAARGAEA